MRADELQGRLGGGPLLLDGAMGTMLLAAGLAPGQTPERWVLERPEAIAAVHRAYVSAGADIVSTCTFGGSPPKLRTAGLAGSCRDINRRAVDLARETAGGALVAGDIGPTGLVLPPVGTASEAELEAAFAEQVASLIGAGVDLLLIETMFDLREAVCAVRACKEVSTFPVLVSMAFQTDKNGGRTVMGDTAEQCARQLTEAGADVIGANCGDLDPYQMAAVVGVLASATSLPVLAQPNAGKPILVEDRTVFKMEPGAYAEGIAKCIEAGARLVGGCCGTTPEHIEAVRRQIGHA